MCLPPFCDVLHSAGDLCQAACLLECSTASHPEIVPTQDVTKPFMRDCIYARAHTQTHTHTPGHTHAFGHMCTHADTETVLSHTTSNLPPDSQKFHTYIYTHTHMHACARTNTHTHTQSCFLNQLTLKPEIHSFIKPYATKVWKTKFSDTMHGQPLHG